MNIERAHIEMQIRWCNAIFRLLVPIQHAPHKTSSKTEVALKSHHFRSFIYRVEGIQKRTIRINFQVYQHIFGLMQFSLCIKLSVCLIWLDSNEGTSNNDFTKWLKRSAKCSLNQLINRRVYVKSDQAFQTLHTATKNNKNGNGSSSNRSTSTSTPYLPFIC